MVLMGLMSPMWRRMMMWLMKPLTLRTKKTPRTGAQKLYIYSGRGGRTRAPPDPPICVGGLRPPTPPFKAASGLPIYEFFNSDLIK